MVVVSLCPEAFALILQLIMESNQMHGLRPFFDSVRRAIAYDGVLALLASGMYVGSEAIARSAIEVRGDEDDAGVLDIARGEARVRCSRRGSTLSRVDGMGEIVSEYIWRKLDECMPQP